MILALGCCAYVIIFLFSKNQDNTMPEKSSVVAAKEIGLVSSSPVFDLKPYVPSGNAQARDIFSLTTTVGPSGAVENTPKGQLPAHMKIVGILVANPSQIIIEDTSTKSTYFIDEGHPQAGIKIVRVGKSQMIINYQGQDIPVPIKKDY
jgi:type II secretory pathway component PulC